MNLKAVCFGEVLWDVFPTHKKIGGAPLNVALRLQSLGMNTAIVSKIGNDNNGAQILNYIRENFVSTNFIQKDTIHKTGEVSVILDKKGSATYTINYPVAWDYIEFNTDTQKLVSNVDVFIYGSLACRHSVSKDTLFNLLKYSKFKVLDVNLRTPHFTNKILLDLMSVSDFIKFNDEELIEICNTNNMIYSSLEIGVKMISKLTNTNKICVTRGSDGAVLFIDNVFYYNEGVTVKVLDTVGAGDSFLAALIYKLLNNINPQYSLDFACAMGSIVASRKGANPIISENEININLLK